MTRDESSILVLASSEVFLSIVQAASPVQQVQQQVPDSNGHLHLLQVGVQNALLLHQYFYNFYNFAQIYHQQEHAPLMHCMTKTHASCAWPL